jgi:hypothetical protein
MQLGWPLPFILDTDGKRPLEIPSRIDYVLSNLAPDNPLLRRVPHLELAARNFRGRDNFEIGDWHEVADFQLALAHDGQVRSCCGPKGFTALVGPDGEKCRAAFSVSAADTFTSVHRFWLARHAPSLLQNTRLSSNEANPLSRSRN